MIDEIKFLRFYIYWDVIKKCFMEGYRPTIGLDGCFLKTPYKVMLPTTVGIGGDNAMFLIAYAMVESKCMETWSWFLDFLKEDLEIKNNHGWIIILDKQKRLITLIENLFPYSEQRMCVRHLYQNFKPNHFGLALKQQL